MFQSFMNSAPKTIPLFNANIDHLNLPSLQPVDLRDISFNVARIFKSEKTLLRLNGPITTIGDIHGHILDLFYVIQRLGLPPLRRYLFLGDLVDRGEFSIETVTIVFLMKLIWPGDVYIIRGNHEFLYQCSTGGFTEQIQNEYFDSSITESFICAFNFMPLAAVINNKYVAVHGGIGPSIKDLKTIEEVQRPISEYGNEVADTLTWSDPNKDLLEFAASTRGLGYYFGLEATENFLAQDNTSVIIRGHECVMEGIEDHFNGRVFTVFSASNYCGLVNNKGAAFIINEENNHEIITWGPFQYPSRARTYFIRPRSKTSLRKTLKATQSTKILPKYGGVIGDPPVRQKVPETKSYGEVKITIPKKISIRPMQDARSKRLLCTFSSCEISTFDFQ
ncbi:Ser/Thr protein phosphatase, putative [Trichomonas vaginalis G3]|uniref:Serine/threonine-protein phosphatase n=1 Tax=Trichomonas vaginalis (strain ATCC PRA-98 / G3) TaxID=412133 RepID=A2EXC7_TRIV3|nr:phosphoprotein phosphatase protein [Trichomonas vaginalis G3]EAY02676.1 Ser/Thr protein phosphatase, putative [Trichomonas vaginalis G3]KAI5507574.1 phosphoprotein phosphatase protein [Trichomonas vaginalis G3]|eukprot:XP_001314899.1 Ser/Thr protein phosphatase [Trichomonas vaginalis G3]